MEIVYKLKSRTDELVYKLIYRRINMCICDMSEVGWKRKFVWYVMKGIYLYSGIGKVAMVWMHVEKSYDALLWVIGSGWFGGGGW